MAKRHKQIFVNIAYTNGSLRSTVQNEIAFLSELNALLDGHKELTPHSDPVLPRITEESSAHYGCNVHLKFDARARDGKDFNYPRLHFVLSEIARICQEYKERFIRMEWSLYLSDSTQPWTLAVGPAQSLLRKGAAQYNATGNFIPVRDADFNVEINGMTVLGEPGAVEEFRKVWEFYARSFWEKAENKTEAAIRSGIGPSLRINTMKALHPKINWAHLQVWVHSPHAEQWYVNNLDHKDKWLVMGVQYTANFNKEMTTEALNYTNSRLGEDGKPINNVLLPDMELISFETKPQEVEEIVVSE